MTIAAKSGAALHVSAIAGATEIATAVKGNGIAMQTAGRMSVRTLRAEGPAGIETLIEIEVTGTEIGIGHAEGGSEMLYH